MHTLCDMLSLFQSIEKKTLNEIIIPFLIQNLESNIIPNPQ